ncbi:PREDICTED: calcium-dependent protein kinase 8-like [Nicotiana attenuata]|uniref:calcium-dependent protein kinase 8-like n=1 Tax=Nicotiana attenuata TaxID=49451 RepID=UPI000904CDE6|nr:PREDICTED: calcium-dependent protein kinase 8-like [Nicotiana attenuata]
MEEEKKLTRKNRMDIQKQKRPKFSPENNAWVIFGPMFAGKTTALLRQVNCEAKMGRNMVIAEFLSAEEVAGMKEAFDQMDTGKKGKINLGELKIGLQKLGHQIPDADLQILMEAADVDRDGYLNYAEFVAVSVHLRKMANDEHLHKAFLFFDRNESGYIEIEELRSALSDEDDGNSEEVINAIMHDVDTDKGLRLHCYY